MAPEPLPKAAHVKMHSKASEPSKKRRTIPLFPRFRKVPDIQSQLFGEDDKFSHDSPSRTLEAFVAELGMIRKVPFGHDRLVYGLNQVHKHRLIATWAKYLNSTAEKQALIGKTTDMAKRMSHRAMSLLTFHEIERPDGSEAILAFFALNQLQEPVTFIDFAQRRHSIPFGACQSHDVWTNVAPCLQHQRANACLSHRAFMNSSWRCTRTRLTCQSHCPKVNLNGKLVTGLLRQYTLCCGVLR